MDTKMRFDVGGDTKMRFDVGGDTNIGRGHQHGQGTPRLGGENTNKGVKLVKALS
jgi:hypothetical protein